MLSRGMRQQGAARAAEGLARIASGLRSRAYSAGLSLGGSRGVSPLHTVSLVLNVALQFAAVFEAEEPGGSAVASATPGEPGRAAGVGKGEEGTRDARALCLAVAELYILARSGVLSLLDVSLSAARQPREGGAVRRGRLVAAVDCYIFVFLIAGRELEAREVHDCFVVFFVEVQMTASARTHRRWIAGACRPLQCPSRPCLQRRLRTQP